MSDRVATFRPVDIHGMNPRTVLYERTSRCGRISIIVPLTYLRGFSDRCHHNLKFTVEYEITAANWSNSVGFVQVSACHRDYDTPVAMVELVADDRVIGAIKDTLDYFAYVHCALRDKNEKDHPASYEEWSRWKDIHVDR